MKTITTMSALLAFMMSACPVLAEQIHSDEQAKITVTGEAVIKVKPDTIVVNLEIETEDGDINVAKTKNAETFGKVLAVLKQCGVTEKDIQRDHLSIRPKLQEEEEKKKKPRVSYIAYNRFMVTTSATVNIEDIITKVLQVGVSSVSEVNFETSEYKKYREQARELALIAAKEKAEKMAKALGQSIGAPINITEGRMYYDNFSSQRQVRVTSNDSDERGAVVLGSIIVSANVTVTFELKK